MLIYDETYSKKGAPEDFTPKVGLHKCGQFHKPVEYYW
jgi:hypothetical protein